MFNYKPHKKQEEIHRACSLKSTNLWTIVCAGRQAGKSKCAKYQSLFWSLKNDKCRVWYVLPSESQARKVFRDIYSDIIDLNIVKSKIQSKGDIHIEFYNGSKIEFKTSASEDNLRSSDVEFLILDEAAFIKRDIIMNAILPTMGVKGKKILVISTPKGKNYFHELWMKGFSEEFSQDFKSFKFSSIDNPEANLKLINTFKQSLPEAVFKQEFEAEFIDAAAVFCNIKELAVLQQQSKPSPGYRYYMGVDIALAAKGDFTVISIVNNLGEMVYMDRFRGVETPELIERVKSSYKLFRPLECVIEQNNQGLPIIQSLKKDIPNIKGFYTTNDSKSDIINNLIAAFNMKHIKIINDDNLKQELEAFVFKFSDTGKIQFGASSGFHDDCVMSLAICYDSYNKSNRTGGYHIMSNESFVKSDNTSPKSFINYYADDNDLRWNGDESNEFIFYNQ